MNEFVKEPLLELNSITKNIGNNTLLRQIQLTIYSEDKIALLGPSGSGKSTLAKIIKGYQSHTFGKISYQSQLITQSSDLLNNSEIQLVFQNPHESLSPQYKILNLLTEPLYLYKKWTKPQALNWLEKHCHYLKLPLSLLNKYPHELSGGEKQRIALLRALSVRPKLLICDEVLSALDLDSQKQVLNLLKEYVFDEKAALIFITHDISIIEYICDKAIVLYDGMIVESGSAQQIKTQPAHKFTQQSCESLNWLTN